VPLQATGDLSGRTNSQAAGPRCISHLLGNFLGLKYNSLNIKALSTNGAVHTTLGQRPRTSGDMRDGKALFYNGLRRPWALPKAGVGRAFSPQTKSIDLSMHSGFMTYA
jgi:hypothetical protein